jgi:hypothetical protein
MIGKTFLRIGMSMSAVLVLHAIYPAQNVSELKPGVVRIVNNRTAEVGAGFIVKADGSEVYIITASHVVKGDQHPHVYLFNRQHTALLSDVLDSEYSDPTKGLALLHLKLPSTSRAGITALKLGYSSPLDGGETVKIIGFPDGTDFWTVGTGNVARIEGRNLVFQGSVRSGNSGGPVIHEGLVVGMVTDVSQASGYAARSEALEPYINGIVPNPTKLVRSQDREQVAAANEFCTTLNKLLEESKNGFYSLVGTPTNTANTFSATIMMPGATAGFVIPPKKVHYRLLTIKEKGTVESQFYSAVSRVRECSKWQEKEDSDSVYRYHKFRKNVGGVVVEVYYNPVASREHYFLSLEVVVPDERRREW